MTFDDIWTGETNAAVDNRAWRGRDHTEIIIGADNDMAKLDSATTIIVRERRDCERLFFFRHWQIFAAKCGEQIEEQRFLDSSRAGRQYDR